MNVLLERIKKNTTIKDSAVLEQSIFLNEKDVIPIKIPILNIALSGSLHGGLTAGLTTFAGPSKHFKSMFSLLLAKAYMDFYNDAVMIFYDSEFGTPKAYFDSIGIDQSRVLHSPIPDIEVLKFDIVNQLTALTRGEHVIIVVDSVGMLASKKEVQDAVDQKETADMTRARQLKSLCRIITPYLTLKNIPMVIVNHVYKTMSLFPTDVVGGGTGTYLASDNIYIIGRQQEKDGSEVAGYNFIINVDKSRYVREKSKIPVTVKFDGGLSLWSGLLEIALDSGIVTSPTKGWYSRVVDGITEERKWRKAATDCKEFWEPILANPAFEEWIQKTYRISSGKLIADEDIDREVQDYQ